VASQVAAWRKRVAADDLPRPEALPCMDEGYRGATRVRPALARRRDLAAAGALDRLDVHAPDRLARPYADPGLLVDAFPHAGVEVICLNREWGQSPADDLRLQVQGMLAEDERATMIERHRCGTRYAARAGPVHGLRGAPDGDHDMSKDEGHGQARDAAVPDAARVVRQVLDGVERDRLTSGEGGRRLPPAGDVTRRGQTIWARRVVWGRWKHPASRGSAACGKTPQAPLRPRLRAQRGRPRQPRRAVSTRDVPPPEWITMPGPALVAPEVLTAVQEQWRDHQRHARPLRRGARYVLQGLMPGHHGGDASDGTRLSPRARTGRPWA
jgi:site-specific DNA recombinase